MCRLIGTATVLTPNLAEAAALTGREQITSLKGMEEAARQLHAKGAVSVLVKGGHLEDEPDAGAGFSRVWSWLGSQDVMFMTCQRCCSGQARDCTSKVQPLVPVKDGQLKVPLSWQSNALPGAGDSETCVRACRALGLGLASQIHLKAGLLVKGGHLGDELSTVAFQTAKALKLRVKEQSSCTL